MADNAETTNVSEVEIDLDQLTQEFVTANNVITPASPKISAQTPPDKLQFLNETEEEEEESEEDGLSVATPNVDEVVNTTVAEIETGEEVAAAGRKKFSKDLLLDVISPLVEKGKIALFEEQTDLEKYTKEDLIELIESNLGQYEEKANAEVPEKFFNSLPEKLQYAAAYVANGGNDLESLFASLLQQERIEKLDPDSEAGQKAIARQYLEFTKFGTQEEIEEEVTGWLDRGELQKKANQFKPKLEARNKELIDLQVKQQEELRRQHQEASERYVADVYETLKDSELNGIKMDKKTQGALYHGLVNANYQSYTGQRTNELGYLLEKYQVVEPNHALIAEVLWHLRDPEGFKAKLAEVGEKVSTEKTVRKLKMEQSTRQTATTTLPENNETKKVKRTISRPAGPPKFSRV